VVENIAALKYSGDGFDLVILRDGSVGPIYSNNTSPSDWSLDGVAFRCGPSGENGCP